MCKLHRIAFVTVLLCPVPAGSSAAMPQAGPEARPAGAAEAAPASRQDPVPSPADVLGHDLGERFTDHAGVVRYMEALSEASPRVEIRRYGATVEGRPLVQVVIAKEAYLGRRDELLANNRELTDPSTAETRARTLAQANPAVVYFSYGVHGNESSSSEAALWTAWDLARDAPGAAGVLDSVIVVIDPAVNPDGRDRYVNWYRQAMGERPNPNPESREHWEPWPGGRFNHYLFDLNRDWSWLTQDETRARLATWETWNPQVHVDFHEMSFNSSYFFFPAAEPINPLYPEHILEWGRYFGESNAAAFDERGWPYYTAESFDLFYPGYGDSWPSLLGAIGMTYEQAGHSRAGLVVKRPDGQMLALRDRAEHHRTSGLATLRATAQRKSELLLDFARFHRSVGDGLPDVLLVPGPDADRAGALVTLLREQGIRVERATREFRAEARAHAGFRDRRSFPAGTYRVPARQARGRLAVTLLQPETVLDATFSYDVSAWSLPYAYGVEAHRIDRAPDAGWEAVADRTPAPVTASPVRQGALTDAAEQEPEPYGYLLAPSFANWPGLIRFLESGGRASVLDERFTLEERTWPAGTLFLPRHGNDGLTARVRAAGLLERARPAQSGFTADGHDLGTDEAYNLELPRVAVLTGDGVSPTSFGAHWFFLERTLRLPFDAVPGDQLGSIRLDDYDVLVIPETAGSSAVGERQLERIKAWVERGGTVVAVGSGARAVAEPLAEVEVRREDEEEDEEDEEDEEEDVGRALRGRAARELERWEEQIPGTILSVRLDRDHPLAFGAAADGDSEQLFVLHRGGLGFEPDTRFETVAYFPDGLEKVSGVISASNLERLAQASWLVVRPVRSGRVILFADDPLFRHFWYSMYQVYASALIVGPRL